MFISSSIDSIDTAHNRSLNLFYAPGARDLLPLAVAQKKWIEAKIESVWQQWGYHEIITSTLEPLETLMAGGAVDRETVFQIPNPEGEMLGLRPELTASIARAAITRMSDFYPHRLYYNANVFRRAPIGHHGRQQEFYQAGMELLGAGGSIADAEVLLLLIDCLDRLAVPNYQILLGDAGLTRALLAEFPPEYQPQVRQCWAHLDRISLGELPLSPDQKALALATLDLRGTPAKVLAKLAALPLADRDRSSINNLQETISLISTSHAQPQAIVLDLSLIQTFDYYTGIVFEAVSMGSDRTPIVAQGGRYDKLLGLYHPQRQDCPGIGFSLNIDALQQVLQSHPAMPRKTTQPDWLVVAIEPTAASAAFQYAKELREGGARVEICLENQIDRLALKEIATTRQIAHLAWVSSKGVEVE
jgi:ATP phosphoribosyltransferase regulatory subunit